MAFSTPQRIHAPQILYVMYFLSVDRRCSLRVAESAQEPRSMQAYLGFDLNTYPGDDALLILRKTFSFAGYWLNSPPGAKQNNWAGPELCEIAQPGDGGQARCRTK